MNWLKGTFTLLLAIAFAIPGASVDHSASGAQAVRGVPGSAEFGIGANLNLAGENLPAAVDLTGSMHLDWVAIDFPWSVYMPDADSNPDWSAFDRAIQATVKAGSAAMLSISAPPVWAITPSGPDPSATVALLKAILQRHPGVIQAVELFPSPNTLAGWGTGPNAGAYLALYKSVKQSLSQIQASVLLVAGGLEINSQKTNPNNVSAVDYLHSLYEDDPDLDIPIIGLRLKGIQGNPSDPVSVEPNQAFRQYEDIRGLMAASGRKNDLIWITGLEFASPTTAGAQTDWLIDAINQTRSQLYIGTVFLVSLNTCPAECAEAPLLGSNGNPFPIASILKNYLLQKTTQQSSYNPARTKNDFFRN